VSFVVENDETAIRFGEAMIRNMRMSIISTTSATWRSRLHETHGFASPPRDGFAFIGCVHSAQGTIPLSTIKIRAKTVNLQHVDFQPKFKTLVLPAEATDYFFTTWDYKWLYVHGPSSACG